MLAITSQQAFQVCQAVSVLNAIPEPYGRARMAINATWSLAGEALGLTGSCNSIRASLGKNSRMVQVDSVEGASSIGLYVMTDPSNAASQLFLANQDLFASSAINLRSLGRHPLHKPMGEPVQISSVRMASEDQMETRTFVRVMDLWTERDSTAAQAEGARMQQERALLALWGGLTVSRVFDASDPYPSHPEARLVMGGDLAGALAAHQKGFAWVRAEIDSSRTVAPSPISDHPLIPRLGG